MSRHPIKFLHQCPLDGDRRRGVPLGDRNRFRRTDRRTRAPGRRISLPVAAAEGGRIQQRTQARSPQGTYRELADSVSATRGRGELKVREVIARLQDDGWFLVATRGSHRQFKHPVKPGRVTVAGNPSDALAPGTLRSILKQAQMKEWR